MDRIFHAPRGEKDVTYLTRAIFLSMLLVLATKISIDMCLVDSELFQQIISLFYTLVGY